MARRPINTSDGLDFLKKMVKNSPSAAGGNKQKTDKHEKTVEAVEKKTQPSGPRENVRGKETTTREGGAAVSQPRRPSSLTNAGHYFFVRGEDGSRDFGRRLPSMKMTDLLGGPGRRLADRPLVRSIPYPDYFLIPDAHNDFRLKTVYPGMLIGVGYSHPIEEKNENDFQSGFFFDWTTGVPVIPGSTIKGVLRSVFPKKEDNGDIKKGKTDYILSKLPKNQSADVSNPEHFEKNLQTTIFETGGNVFYDAYIEDIPENGKVFSEDYITPHKNPFANPVPLRFLKIGPNVTFRFQFKLQPLKVGGFDVTTENQKALFKQILLDFGIGAKRNTGYGALVEENG